MMHHSVTDDPAHGIGVGYTLALTQAFAKGEISADDYVHKRAELIGRPNFVHGFLLPFYHAVRLKLALRNK